ncbi:hypothetical protein MHU86_21356 [Fragilaria crotonensis]|nr:hypothetical protein MHU86_21356 [Fragilaria crotonensis]
MDFLASLNLDELPEQQTRAAHLSRKLANDPDLRLGFNCCCSCGKQEVALSLCPNCKRVSYCSDACREEDIRPAVDEDEGALGHSSIICSVLKICNDDEDAEDLVGGTDAARNRVRSELESYPATMANILREGPCYQDYLSSVGKDLVIHVIGASEEAELWNGESAQDIYASLPNTPVSLLKDLLRDISKPQVVVLFNPGFTCPDYDWEETMDLLDHGIAFLSTTNTEMEGVSDCNHLMDKKLFPHLPPLAAEIMGVEDYGDLTFFSENPYAGTRIRQSGTMANDVYVKNRWMIGGILAKPMKKRSRDDDNEGDIYNKGPPGNSKKSNPALI